MSAMGSNFSWDTFHSACSQVSNASIICEDGVISTHKLILANMSRLMMDILRDIPAADEVTLYLKPFSKIKVQTFLSNVLQKKDCNEIELCSIFDIKNHTSPIKKEKDDEIGFTNEGDEQQIAKVEAKENSFFEDDTVEYVNVKPDIVLRKMNESVKCEQEELPETFDSETEENIKNFEKELVQNPKTKRDFLSNQKIDKKIRYAKAVASFRSGRVNSYRGAALKYGVADSVLRKYILSGESFRGKGPILSRFTKEEEKIIADRALKLTSSEGKDLTYQLLIDIVLEEAEVVKINQPERSDQMEFGNERSKIYSFVHNFARRHNIKNLINSEIKKDRDQRRNFECEVCYRTFTYKNTLVTHRRKSHSFLFGRS